jgi:2-amino-4-hydroxy-6-hydroxymethyldihydropteridine diphosphokinase
MSFQDARHLSSQNEILFKDLEIINKSNMAEVLLALGSNLGNRQEMLESAWRDIDHLPQTKVLRISRFHQTQPVGGPPNQPEFLNAVCSVCTDLQPQRLLEKLQEIEIRFGRIRAEHWGPRTLDIDILLYGDQIICTPALSVPHPEMLYRSFVLEPAQEIAADTVHPVTGKTLQEHYRLLRRK